MTPESITISMPLPARVLEPNCTVGTFGGRMMKASASKRYRRLACEAVEEAGIESAPWGRVSVKAEFRHKCKRRHDQDNATGSLKAAYDGIVDSGLVSDDDSEHMDREKPTFSIDKVNPGVILVITRLE